MATIFYSMAGEGRGHAARVNTLVEQLRHDHKLILFAPGEAHDFLEPLYCRHWPQVEVRRIPGMAFHYTRGRLDLAKSICRGLSYLRQLPNVVRGLCRAIDEERPVLAITDFEPALPRAARAMGVPILSLDHQNFLLSYDLSSLPWMLRQQAWLLGLAVRAYCHWQDATVVSAFYRPPLKRGREHVIQVGPLLRREVRQARPERGEYVVSYLRKNTPRRVLEMLNECGRPVRVYGLGKRAAEGRLTFRAIDPRRFIDDLAGCAAAIGAAGNQSLGEALYLGKPVFALPEGNHHEQLINAHFLRQMGAGDFAPIERASGGALRRFLHRLDDYYAATSLLVGKLDGTAAALAVIDRMLRLKATIPFAPAAPLSMAEIYERDLLQVG